MRLAVRVGLRIHRGDPRVRCQSFIQSCGTGLRRANQKQIRQTRRRTTLVILIIISIIPSDVIQIPELLLRFLSISLESFSPSSFMERDAPVRQQEFFGKSRSPSLGMLHELKGFDAILGALEQGPGVLVLRQGVIFFLCFIGRCADAAELRKPVIHSSVMWRAWGVRISPIPHGGLADGPVLFSVLPGPSYS